MTASLPGALADLAVLAQEEVPGAEEGLSLAAHGFLLAGSIASVAFILWLLRHRKLRGKYAMLWTTAAIVLLVLALFPGLLSLVSEWLGVYYAPALFLVVAIGFLLVIVIQFSWELSRMDDRTRTLAEEVGLLHAELDHYRAQQAGGADAAAGDAAGREPSPSEGAAPAGDPS